MNDLDVVDERRAAARKRVEAKREFRNHVAIYIIVNAMLVLIWALSGAGYFWPIWPMAGWGIGVAINAYTAYLERPISEDDIRKEMERSR
ncbi:MAG: 2TM domain-containing protein [Acidimicrobiales bacterium]|nr:2TM domain-containing protein [Acidimicrobiales bacterium]